MTPALDVVIPTLNAASTLGRTIATLHAADAGSLSIIVCDGGSRDETAVIARRDRAVVVNAPAGRGVQLAAGAAAGSAPWLLFLHADTVPGDGWHAAVTGFAADPANAERAGYFRLRFESSDRRARRVERLAAWRCRAFGLPYGDQGLLVSRAFYRHIGGFHPLPLMEDVDLARRIGQRRLIPLDADAVTSARRYERDGWIARPLRNLACLSLFLAGASPTLIAALYGR